MMGGSAEEKAGALKKRLEALKAARAPWDATWKEIASYIMPRKDSWGGRSPGDAGDGSIFDATATHALEIEASSLGGMMTNPANVWATIRLKNKDLGDKSEVQEFLEKCTRRLMAVFNSEASGFQTAVHELYLDIALLGTSCMFVEADPDSVVRFSTRPLGEIYVAENARGVVDTVFRRYEATARQVHQMWGDACSDRVRDLLDDKPEERVEILHATYPRSDRDPDGAGNRDMPCGCVYMEVEGPHILEESGYREMPYMVPRWCKAAGEVYGRGPGLTALSDVRVLNVMARTALMAAEKMADSPLMVPDDGFLGPVNTGPGGISYYRAGSSDRIEPLPVKIDLAATERMMQQRRDSIRQIFLNDQLQLINGPQMTATESMIRQNEKMRVLGPVFGRLRSEFLSPLICRVFSLMARAGELPEPPEALVGQDWEIEYVSQMARAQKQADVEAVGRVLEFGAAVEKMVPGVVSENFDADAMLRGVADSLGVPQDYKRDVGERDRMRRQRAKAQQGQQMMASAEQAASIANTLGNTPTTEGRNALAELAQGAA